MPPKKIIKEDIKNFADLHPLEIDLIITLREEYRYGSVEIQMHKGHSQKFTKNNSEEEFRQL